MGLYWRAGPPVPSANAQLQRRQATGAQDSYRISEAYSSRETQSHTTLSAISVAAACILEPSKWPAPLHGLVLINVA